MAGLLPLMAADSADAATATIAGVVRADDTGEPVANVCVVAYLPDISNTAGFGCSDAQGRYTIKGLRSGGTYRLIANAPNPFLYEWAPNGVDPQDGTAYRAPATVSFGLERGTLVSGVLRAANGRPPGRSGSVVLDATDVNTRYAAGAVDGDGTWSVFAAPGTYQVRFEVGGRLSFAFGRTQWGTGTVVTVRRGRAVRVDDVLPAAGARGTLSGRVTSSSGAPVAGVCAKAFVVEARTAGLATVDPARCARSGGTLTGRDGRFKATGLQPRSWLVVVSDPGGRYVTTTSAPVKVTAGGTASVSVRPPRAGTVTGSASDSRTRRPLAGVCPTARALDPDAAGSAPRVTCSDARGRWSVTALRPGRYAIWLSGDARHAGRHVGGDGSPKSARPVVVSAGRSSAVGTVPLLAGAVVTGVVKDRAGRPVPGAWVKIGSFAPAGGPGSGGLTARTDAAGRYRITNVPQMREVAEVYAPGRALAWQWSGGVADPTKARPLALRYGRTTRFDAVLQPEGRIRVVLTGVSSGDGGLPASLAHVQAYTASGSAAVGFGVTVQDDGSHLLRQLPAGTVRLLVRSGPSLTTSSWYDGARSATSATPVTVTAGGTTEVRIAVPVR